MASAAAAASLATAVATVGATRAEAPWRGVLPALEPTRAEVRAAEQRAGARDLRSPEVRGIVVPHHRPAAHLAASGLAAIERGARVLLLAPNHYDAGRAALLSTGDRWRTPFGILEGAGVRASDLGAGSRLGVAEAPGALVREHGVTFALPFLASRGAAEVLPVVVRSNLSAAEIAAAAAALSGYIDPSTIVVVSVDMSHGQSAGRAARFDAESLVALRALDGGAFLRWGAEHSDGRTVLPVFLALMRAQGATQMHVVGRAGSHGLGGRRDTDVTTYFALWYLRSAGHRNVAPGAGVVRQ